MAVVASATGAAVFGLSGVAAGLAGGALLGAGAGALYSGLTGDGNILNSALTGALLGGAAGGLGAAFAPAVTAPTALASAPVSTALVPTANAMTATPALAATKGTLGATALSPTAAASQQALFGLGATSQGAVPAASTFGLTGAPTVAKAAGLAAPAGAATSFAPVVTGSLLPAGYGAGSTAAGMSGKQMLGYGLAGTTALSLLGGRQQGPGAGQMPDPGMVRPYEYSSTPNEATGMYPDPYATAEYTESGNPILDTRERNYFSQNFAPMEPYSAKAGTVNPNEPFKMAAAGGLMYDDSYGMDEARGMMQGNLQKGLFGRGYAEGGSIDEEKRNQLIMKNIKSASTKDLEKIMGAMNQQEFLMKNMPNYAQAMSPSISGMVEGAQYGDRMAKAYGGQPRDINVMPTMVDPQSGMYGGIASIGRQIDPDTRVNAMANIFRTPYDRNATDSVRRLGVGVDRQLGKDTNLSAFYEQDPMGRNKMGGARLTQRFDNGGITYDADKQQYSGLPGMIGNSTPLSAELIAQLTPQYQAANPNRFSYDSAQQRYGAAKPTMAQLNAYKAEQDRITAEQMNPFMAFFPGAFGGNFAAGGQVQRMSGGGMMNFFLRTLQESNKNSSDPALRNFIHFENDELSNVPQQAQSVNSLPKYKYNPQEQAYTTLATGGHLGGYSDGGRMLKGPGDGMSDDIPGVIGNKQPARLADGEFVVPADVVSHLGNGSTDAGAKRLYAMMDEVRRARTGNKKQGKKIKAEKYLPA
jgi:hypothetical protein